MSIPTTTKEVVKSYKVWCIKATNAANEAKRKGVAKESFPAYIAADNIAKQLFSKLQ